MTQRRLLAEERQAYTPGPRESLAKSSPEFARRTIAHLRFLWANVRADERQFQEQLEEIEALRIYERWPVDAPYGNLNALCAAELATPLPVVQQTVSEVAVNRAEREGKIARRGNQPKDHTMIFADRQGTDPTYLARRLLRDAPEVFERLKAGEYPSVHAAAQAAGIVPPMLQAVRTPKGVARAVRRHFTPEQIAELVRLLGAEP